MNTNHGHMKTRSDLTDSLNIDIGARTFTIETTSVRELRGRG